jgi:FAD/FMN-containing dehydrogenase
MARNEQELLARVGAVLSSGQVDADPASVASYRPTSPFAHRREAPALVARPANVSELQDLVRLAYREGLALVPASSAPPHHKGGIGCQGDFIVVDLSGWKTIDLVDRRNRVARIQPGVTFTELLAGLQPHGLTVPMPLAPRDGKSVRPGTPAGRAQVGLRHGLRVA